MFSQPYTLAVTLISFALFWLAVGFGGEQKGPHYERPAFVYVDGPTQVIMYAGDRFLAANIGTIRATVSAATTGPSEFSIRAYTGVSRLNPCQEDNYWVGNASLTWGGAEKQGSQILRNAMRCRFWDEWPAFYYGFNQNFFHHDIPAARKALEIAAQRSTTNAAAFRTFSIMLAANQIDDTRAALKMLKNERDKAKDPQLRKMLKKRVERIQGLLTLRDAQKAYEKRFGKPLKHPGQLISSGILKGFPEDPLKQGYEFQDHSFQLHQYQVK